MKLILNVIGIIAFCLVILFAPAAQVVFVVLLVAFGVFANQFLKWLLWTPKHRKRSQGVLSLCSAMVLLWTIGWILHIRAFQCFPEGHHFDNTELLMRSAIASLNLFMLNIDSDILNLIKEHIYLKGAITTICLLSFLCTVALFISLVWTRVWAYYKLVHCSQVTRNRSHLYVFFGLDDNTGQLAWSIRENDSKSIRIFVEKAMGDEEDGQEEWNHLLSLLTYKREVFKKVSELDARLALADYSINSLQGSTNVLDEAGLDSIGRKIRRLAKIGKKAELHLFFLSGDERVNIDSVAVMSQDVIIQKAAANGVKVVLYCKAMHNSINFEIEHFAYQNSLEVRLVDPSSVSVELLKTRENIHLQPVSFVDIKPDGTTMSAFNALVIGFGETGQHAVRFLYEYGAFVNHDKILGVRRSPFSCHVVDANMQTIAPSYMGTHLRMNNPKTGEVLPLIALDSDLPAFVNLHPFGYQEQGFINLLDSVLDTLNYVVIALGKDQENIALAVWLLEYAMRKKKKLNNFRILVRSYLSEQLPYEEETTRYYNGLVGMDVIQLFGKPKDIYSYSAIVCDQIRREAWLYYNSYYGVSMLQDKDFEKLDEEQKQSGKYCSVYVPDYAWRIRRSKELTVGANGYPNYAQVMSIRRKEEQEMENAFHRHTKLYVAQKASGDEEAQLNDTLRTTLAQMEHLRWNASHEMLGYVWGQQKSDASSEHPCLVAWEDLTEEIQGYDYEVVDRSFHINEHS